MVSWQKNCRSLSHTQNTVKHHKLLKGDTISSTRNGTDRPIELLQTSHCKADPQTPSDEELRDSKAEPLPACQRQQKRKSFWRSRWDSNQGPSELGGVGGVARNHCIIGSNGKEVGQLLAGRELVEESDGLREMPAVPACLPQLPV